MKNFVFYCLLMLLVTAGFAQTDTAALYFKYPNVPPFTITKVPDSTKFVKANLLPKKPVLIMIFSPDCEHCIHEVKEILSHMELFKNVQIVMVAHLDFKNLKKFYNEYKLANYPNITLGRDYSYFFGTFYSLKFLPGMFLYNKKGKFVQSFDGSVPVKRIAAAL